MAKYDFILRDKSYRDKCVFSLEAASLFEACYIVNELYLPAQEHYTLLKVLCGGETVLDLRATPSRYDGK